MICPACTALESPKVRTCALCGETVCKETAESRVIREGARPWRKEWCCEDSFACIARVAKRVIK